MGLIENLLPPRFEIIKELGRGGTSIVFHAKDADREHQDVAVKVLLKDSEEDRFQREAERLAALSHPNVVAFLEVGHFEGRDFLVMEYLTMGDLAEYTVGLELVKILRLFTQVCDGLAHLHDQGIVHRDLKPANILVAADGRPKITDLGVARQMERNTRLTQAGTILGTYSYLAPEQILSSTVGPRADLYSLGVCLFMAVTGRKPFEADNEFKMLKAHLEETPPLIRTLVPKAPECLEKLVASMLAKDENDRPRSARAVADALIEAIRELEQQDQQAHEPDWDGVVEELPEEQRSVLLAVSYLGQEATFEKVCQACPFAEDKTDRYLEALMENRLIDSPTEDRFSLRVPEDTVATRLTPRLRKLFAQRLSALAGSAELKEDEDTIRDVPLHVEEDDTVIGDTSEALESAAVAPELVQEQEVAKPAKAKEQPVSEPATTQPLEPSPTPVPISPLSDPKTTASRPPKTFGPEWVPLTAGADSKDGDKTDSTSPTPTLEKKPRWALMSAIMLVVGVILTVGGQWFWSHSASLQISTTPLGAKVKVDGVEVGTTPLTASRLEPGMHAVEISMPGHRGVEDKVEVGFMQKQESHFTLEQRVGQLLLTLNPKDASVTLDGEVKGVINSDLSLPIGEHKLEVSKKGFEVYKSEVVIDEDKPLEMEVSLTPVVAAVEVTSTPPGASVTLSGGFQGKTPVTFEKVPYGKHEIAVRLKGHERVNDTVEVDSGKKVEFKATLKELPGALAVTTVPEGVKIKINGEDKGKTPLNLTGLKEGDYTISLSKDGYYAVEEKRKVEAGEVTKAEFRLSAIVVARPPSHSGSGGYTPPSRPYRPPPVHQPPPSRPKPPSHSGGNPWIVE